MRVVVIDGGDLVGKRAKAWLPPSVGKAQYIGLRPSSYLHVIPSHSCRYSCIKIHFFLQYTATP